ncbi:Type 1 glutamine amidotransferase-like domain-containing protein [Streptomyces sp. NPDC102402]|uniref:Type 1 glutamine amidotransferase-like domain-containing protein n=1 Tax=Streptomyces sp. NPDC102402 TaxID=3366169 RepID=UPI00381FF764
MRMYLSSFRIGDHPDRLLSLLDGPDTTGEVAVVVNALDALPDDERKTALGREADALAALGLRPVELDLRAFFDEQPGRVADALRRFPLVWVRGGNVFVLRHALARSGADHALIDLVRRDAIVYAGYSAGACVLAPDLRGLEQCDDPGAVMTAYGAAARQDGLALLDYVVLPHIDSPGHPETEVLTRVAELFRNAGTAHQPLRDGQVIVIDGESTEIH